MTQTFEHFQIEVKKRKKFLKDLSSTIESVLSCLSFEIKASKTEENSKTKNKFLN